MNIRPLRSEDYDVIAPVLDAWWGERPVRQLLPRLFFEHFAPTSFALVDGEALCAFLAGFISQTDPAIAYIHFVGVAPAHRKRGHARRLYLHFFERAAALGAREVPCITSPMNPDWLA